MQIYLLVVVSTANRKYSLYVILFWEWNLSAKKLSSAAVVKTLAELKFKKYFPHIKQNNLFHCSREELVLFRDKVYPEALSVKQIHCAKG